MRVLVPELLRFWRDESGQDLTEWALLVAFIGISSVAMMTHSGNSISVVWTNAQMTLQQSQPANGGSSH
jgi:Flp pilus assembly pilin Flp